MRDPLGKRTALAVRSSGTVTLVRMFFEGFDALPRAVRRIAAALCVVLIAELVFAAGAESAVHGYWIRGVEGGGGDNPSGADKIAQQVPAVHKSTLKGTDFVVIGDSYHASATTPYHEAAEQLADISGLTLHNYAVGGAGWLTAPSKDGMSQTFAEQIDEAVDDAPSFASKTAFVLVSGGYNDANEKAYDADSETLAKTVRAGFRKLRRAFPEAKLVYVPYLRANNPILPRYFDLTAVETAVDAAEKEDVIVAKYAWEWNLGQDQFFDAQRDPVHPSSDAGFRYMAEQEWKIIQGEDVPRTSVDETFTGVTADGWLDYQVNIKLRNGKVTGTLKVTPNRTSSPDAEADNDGYRELTPDSSLWNVFYGWTDALTDEVKVKVLTGPFESKDAFILSGPGVLRKGTAYTASFAEELGLGFWSDDSYDSSDGTDG